LPVPKLNLRNSDDYIEPLKDKMNAAEDNAAEDASSPDQQQNLTTCSFVNIDCI